MDSEENLLKQAKAQDQVAFSRLQTQYEPLIRAQIASVTRKLDSRLHEDCRQEALLAFHRAIQSYNDTQNGVTFGLYAKICIHNRLCSFLRKQKKVRLASEELDRSHPEVPYGEDLAGQLISHEEYTDRFAKLRSLLSPLEQEVLLRSGAGEKPREIAIAMGKAPKVIYNALSRIQAKRKGMKLR